MNQEAVVERSTEYRDSVVLCALGLVFGAAFTMYFKVRGLDAFTFIICMPIAFLSIARGLKYGALTSIVGAALYGSFVLFNIIQGAAAAGFIRESIVNIAIIVSVGFILGTISETMRFRDANVFQNITTVETFVPDEDTGLYNFKSFRWMLAGEMRRVRRYNTPLSLVFLRVENLDEFQARYDYTEEVNLFRELGRFFRGLIRDADYIGKYSDNEIGIILSETNANGVNIVLHRVGENRDRVVGHIGESWDKVSLRMSVASANYPKDASNLEELVDVLDARYRTF
ncbi:diguanylate cyclase [bacterium]|nr:diguanylate cyclase [bacterium]